MIRICLWLLCFITLFIAVASWSYFIIGFALWKFVFGDDSTTLGYYALAAAIPVSLAITSLYMGLAIRWPFGWPMLTGTILVAAISEVLFIICIRS